MPSTYIAGTEYRFFSHIYAVSREGKFLRFLKPVEPTIRLDGYMHVGGKILAHRMVATCWLVKPEGANHVHHLNHDKADNRADNLAWVTPKQHMTEHHDHAGRYQRTEATKQKLREYRTGKAASDETKQKQREASLRLGCKPPPRKVGETHSEQAILKMQENSPNAAACEVDGIAYRSFSEAGRALGEKPHSLRKRCLSKNFPNYRMLFPS
ncbi:HNH endonuclease [Massilia sp. PWRC2]|uniref:HNH endonuclease n=1 Tax=Massilia sp. PWRC2 TaxID=2804626 RepID=UPI003CEFBE35